MWLLSTSTISPHTWASSRLSATTSSSECPRLTYLISTCQTSTSQITSEMAPSRLPRIKLSRPDMTTWLQPLTLLSNTPMSTTTWMVPRASSKSSSQTNSMLVTSRTLENGAPRLMPHLLLLSSSHMLETRSMSRFDRSPVETLTLMKSTSSSTKWSINMTESTQTTDDVNRYLPRIYSFTEML